VAGWREGAAGHLDCFDIGWDCNWSGDSKELSAYGAALAEKEIRIEVVWPVLPLNTIQRLLSGLISPSLSLSFLFPTRKTCPHTHTAALVRLRTSLASTTELARKSARAPLASSLRVSSLYVNPEELPDSDFSRFRC